MNGFAERGWSMTGVGLLSRRTAAIAGVVAFVAVDAVLVAMALRASGAPAPAESTTSVTVTQTVWETSAAAVASLQEAQG